MSDDPSDVSHEWVMEGDVDSFVRRLEAIRQGAPDGEGSGEPARPATAIRALHTFALLRGTDDLVGCDKHFGREDAVTVLVTAALCRGVGDAADLAIRQWKAERAVPGGRTPLTDGIVHDVAGQRIALEVATFVRTCWLVDEELAMKALDVFARRRTNRDKAVLYIALRDEGCAETAARLLRLSLDTLTEESSTGTHNTDPAEFHDLVGALYQLSPSEGILENWIDQELKSADQWQPTIERVVDLVTSQRTGPDNLVEYVGRRLELPALISVCEKLYGKSPGRCATIRSHIPSRGEPHQLATIVREWHKSKTLNRTTRDLLADIVVSAAGPRPLDDLDELDKWLRNKGETGPECGRLLWLVAADHVEGRSGTELVALLRKIRSRRDRQRAARRIAEQLAVRVHGGGGEDARCFVEYITGLRRADESDAAYCARRELGDPTGTVKMKAAAIGDIAVELYRAGLPELAGDAWDLLERCLENEQGIRASDVAAVVERLHDSPMPNANRLLLLRATVGRWTDAHRRDDTVAALHEQGFTTDAEHVVRSLR